MIGKEYKGLTEEEVLASRRRHGGNEYGKKKKKSIFRRFLSNFSDPIIRILLLALGVNLIFTIRNINWAETAGIVIAVLISTIVTTISEYGSEKAFEKLQAEQENTAVRVIRGGKTRSVRAHELVVGDLILLSEGEKIAADGKLIYGCLKVDQSAVNGESEPAPKTPGAARGEACMLYAGSLILEGEGQMIVTAVGERSLYGRIAKEIQYESEDSPLKTRLGKLAKAISRIGYAAAALVALTYLFNAFAIDAGFQSAEILARLSNVRYVALKLIKAVTIAMTVIVVAVPEGLPMMITVVLSSNMKKMMRDQVLVRKMIGIETAGCMNLLFTDKTGTLTEGKPVCRELIFANGDRYDGKARLNGRLKELIDVSLFVNTGCAAGSDGPIGGNAAEQALYRFSEPPGDPPDALRKKPFNSKDKYSAVEIASPIAGRTVFFKGAAEKLLPYCRTAFGPDGNETAFDRAATEALIAKLSRRSARILVMAAGTRFAEPNNTGALTFLCVAVLSDGLRKTAAEAVRDLQSAGVHTVMITGDSKETAMKIAEECGILNRRTNAALTGDELQKMSDSEVISVLPRLAVIARALPSDKTRLVSLSKKAGMIVGMTGDGVNDAPALKNADVGFAMGSGIDIAKEAGSIVILDNDLSSIVNAVLYGRTVFKSIRKFITFQLIMNFFAVGMSFIGQLFGIENPITVIQMLWVNVIMDTLGGLAFAGEHPQRYYLKEKPIGREEPILNGNIYAQIVTMGLYGILVGSVFLGSGFVRERFSYDADPLPMLTAFFALFIFTGIAICFTARSERMNILAGLGKNKPFVFIMLLISVIQLLMLYFGGKTFRCAGIEPRALFSVLAAALSVVPIDLIRRTAGKMLKLKKRRKKTSKQKEKVCRSRREA